MGDSIIDVRGPPLPELTREQLQTNWIWLPHWSEETISTGKVAVFQRNFEVIGSPTAATIHLTADTRYKLFVNGRRVAVGPSRSTTSLWFFDTVDIGAFLRQGHNEVSVHVMRLFPAAEGGTPFVRSSLPGLTVVGRVAMAEGDCVLDSCSGWTAYETGLRFAIDMEDDAFLKVFEEVKLPAFHIPTKAQPYSFSTSTGGMTPWSLEPRINPLPVASEGNVQTVRVVSSHVDSAWSDFFLHDKPICLPPQSQHRLELEFSDYMTAFTTWHFLQAGGSSHVRITYSEGYEKQPRMRPWLRTKGDRTDPDSGELYGPYDSVTVSGEASYEPFWYRAFRFLAIDVDVGEGDLTLQSFCASQTNYPLPLVGSWSSASVVEQRIWQVSVSTLRACLYDGYSDCPFYEQLQYAMDTRSSGLFHYLVSGDDRLMRSAIRLFAASALPCGLTQSRVPSQQGQIIPAFSLYWVMQVCDHMQFFADRHFARRMTPTIDGVLEFFARHTDNRGLVVGLAVHMWQFVDWTPQWSASASYRNGGVPVAGRENNVFSYNTMLYAYTLQRAAVLLSQVGRLAMAKEYEARAVVAVDAVRKHCFDGRYFLDSTTDAAGDYSQHAQIWAVLCGAATVEQAPSLLLDAFGLGVSKPFTGCSYVMTHYAFRAFALAGAQAYTAFWDVAWGPWEAMLGQNLITWNEDSVSERSDCHAWGSIALYEYPIEVAGVHPVESHPGWRKVRFAPLLQLSAEVDCSLALGGHNRAMVSWKTTANVTVTLEFDQPVEVVSCLPGEAEVEHGVVCSLSLTWNR